MSKEVCDLRIEAVVPHYRRWLLTVSGRLLNPNSPNLEDLVQEGYIAMWRALQSLDEDKAPADYWLKHAAYRRMMTVVQRNHWTGQAKRTNGGHGGSKPPERVLFYAEINNAEGSENSWEDDNHLPDLSAQHAIEDAEWAYHNGEIGLVIDSLSPRERQYVIHRFWHEWNGPELDAHFNTHASNIWRKVKPVLREKLSGLIE